MTEQRPTKTCQMCYGQIDERARRCPHCRHPQTKLRSWFARHPLVTAAIIGVVVVGLMWLWAVTVQRLWNPYRSGRACPYRDHIQVVSSETVFGDSKDGPVVCVIGTLENKSDVAWEQIQLEAQFLDSAGKLIDVAKEPRLYYVSHMLPRSQAAFKVRALRDFPKDKYASHKVFVRSAKDDRTWP